MSNLTSQLQSVNCGFLTKLVRIDTGSDTIEVVEWSYSPMEYKTLNQVTAGIFRFTGKGYDRTKTVVWSLILKVIRWVDILGNGGKGLVTDPSDWNYWRREALVYQCGILDAWKGDLVPVHCYLIDEKEDGSIWLWQKEAGDCYASPWSISRYALAARHFGEFNGAYLTKLSLPTQPWLCKDFLKKWIQSGFAFGIIDALHDPDVWDYPCVKWAFPSSVGDSIFRIMEDSESLLSLLRKLPHTLSHMDGHRGNLFACKTVDGRDQTVVIDWALLSDAAVGEDLGVQVSQNLFNLDINVQNARQYLEAAFEAYLEGLHTSGWQVDRSSVRFACLAAASIRGVSLAAYMLTKLVHEPLEETWAFNWANKSGIHVKEVLGRWGRAISFLIDLENEARQLGVHICMK